MKNKKLIKCLFCLLLLNFFLTKTAHAYLDPNNGSMLIQVILASIFGFLCTIKLWFYKILNIFNKNKNEDKKENKDENE